MKNLSLSALAAVAALAFAMPTTIAAESTENNTPPPRRENRAGPNGEARNGGARLSREDFQKITAAVAEAQKVDSVKEARKAFEEAQKKYQDALKAEVLKKDPSLKDIVEKYKGRPLPGANFRAGAAAPNGDRAQGQGPRRQRNAAPKKPASAENL